MRIIIAPAKKMRTDYDIPFKRLPLFLSDARKIVEELKKCNVEELMVLYRSNESIAVQNYERLQTTNLDSALSPALFAYDGIQYQYMAPQVFEESELEYLEEHLRILSGLYGILRPFDGVTSYRLEMQSRLTVGECGNLYEFWGRKMAERLMNETNCIVNLASSEYSRTISRYLPEHFRFINCIFGEKVVEKGVEKIIEKGTMCKMARGSMVRFMAVRGITVPEDLMYFDVDYTFSQEDSDMFRYVFLKKSVTRSR